MELLYNSYMQKQYCMWLSIIVASPTVILDVPLCDALSLRNDDVVVAVASQVYIPDSSLPNESTTMVLVKLIMLFITGCAVLVIINPEGPVHSVTTVTGIFTTGLSSTMQDIVTADPTGRMIPG